MYTVARFTTDSSNLAVVEDIGNRINKIRPDSFVGIRKAGDGFAFGLCADEGWFQHREAVLRFVELAGPIVKSSIELHVSATIDVAIEPEDRANGATLIVVRLDPDLMRELSECGIAIEISRY